MDHYIDIVILPNPEILPMDLMNSLFMQLHRHLVEIKANTIGVSFPRYQKDLGCVMRLHGTAESLQKSANGEWLETMHSYVYWGGLQKVPENVKGYRVVCRRQRCSAERRRRRSIKCNKGNEESWAKITEGKYLKLPFVKLYSQSTEQNMRVYIDHQYLQDKPAAGNFSSYGLSSTATVPWF